MITEKEFLDAFEIIKKYKNQVDDIYYKSEAILNAKNTERFVEIKRNDWIEIIEGNEESKYFIKGARFRVVSSVLRPHWNDGSRFHNFCTEKYGKDYNKIYKSNENSFDLYQNDLIESGVVFFQLINLSLPNKSNYAIKSTNYKYKVIKKNT